MAGVRVDGMLELSNTPRRIGFPLSQASGLSRYEVPVFIGLLGMTVRC